MKIREKLERAAKRTFRALGLEVQRARGATTEEAILARVLGLVAPVAVLDVGANAGQYANALRAIGYRGTIVSFEALPSVHARLLEASGHDSSWLVAPCGALGAETSTLTMNVAGNEASSSLLEMCDRHLGAAPESRYVGVVPVPVRRLDDGLFGELMPREGPLFLKIDTQGYERKVLEGATALLPRVAAIQLELSLVELYKGSPGIAEMIAYAEGLGFELFSVAPGFKDRRSGRLLQLEGFFVHRSVRT